MKKPLKQSTWRVPSRPGGTRFGSGSTPSWFIGRLLVVALILASLLALLAFGGMLIWRQLGQSAFFQVTTIKIDGYVRATQQQILDLSGVDVHSNLLALSAGNIEAKIEAHDWIKSATVIKEWPNGLRITVREREALALLSLPEGFYYIDRFAERFAKVVPPGDLDFPVITGLGAWEELSEQQGQATKQALQLIRLAGRVGVVLPAQGISEINIDRDGTLIMFLVGRPFPIYLGKDLSLPASYNRLVRVLSRLHRERIFGETAAIRMDYLPGRVLVERWLPGGKS